MSWPPTYEENGNTLRYVIRIRPGAHVFKLARTAHCCVEIAQLPLCVCRLHPPLTVIVVVVEDLLVFSRL
jgi:hypothetical protein